MGIYFNPGNVGFSIVSESDYVDKTLLIYELNKVVDTSRRMICSTRPRRFGKSFSAKMLCAYYDISCNSDQVFSRFKIHQKSTLESYFKYLNSFNVIYLDILPFISSIKSDPCRDISGIVSLITESIRNELRDEFDFLDIEDSLESSLLKIVEYTGHKFVCIIDEWDAIFREAKDEYEAQDTYVNFLRNLFKNGNITDKVFALVYMTGILPIKKYGHQSAISDFREYTMIDPGFFADYVGFTDSEVVRLCKSKNVSHEETKSWYDGYNFEGGKSIYSPDSVMQSIEKGSVGSYWTQTETYKTLLTFIGMDYEGLQQDIIRLLGGEEIDVDILPFQNDMTSISSKNDILTLLIHLGYLNYDKTSKKVRIPNKEVSQEFESSIRCSNHSKFIEFVTICDEIMRFVLREDGREVARRFQKIHDLCGDPLHYNNEQALRSTVRTAFIIWMDDFIKIEECASGHGYIDIAYLPKKQSDKVPMIVELKWNKSDYDAIKQIEEKGYPSIFDASDGDILFVGVNYDSDTKEHSCEIKRVKFR